MPETDTNKALLKKIKTNIKELAKTADKMPGAVIIHDLRDWAVLWMSDWGLKQLGVTLNQITSLSFEEYHNYYFNPEDAKDYGPKILRLLEKNNDDQICTYFQQVRLSPADPWHWYMSSTKIFMRDEEEKPLLTVTISFPIDAMHHMTTKAERLLEENNFLRKHYLDFAKLGKRECAILKHLALGQSSAETAETLFISVATVETHRRNIKQKLKTNSFFELTQYARAFDLI